MQHFTDRYKADNQFVHYWDFILGANSPVMCPRGPTTFPTTIPKYDASWEHLLAPAELASALTGCAPSNQFTRSIICGNIGY